MQDEQMEIARQLGVALDFDAPAEAERRTQFLADCLRTSSCQTYVLGISGGVDSLTAGMLAQAAVGRLRELSYEAGFIAVRLPYGVHADEADARQSLDVIGPDRIVTVDIKPAADGMLEAVRVEARS